MKTNLNNIWQKCSWRNLQQNHIQQLSDLFVEHHYYKFQYEMQFFSYYNNRTLKHRHSESFSGCNKPTSCFFQVLHHITCMMGLCQCHGTILFLPFSLTYLRWWEHNAHCLVAHKSTTLSRISAPMIDDAVDQWHKRLHCWVETSGRHFKHSL